MGGFIIGAVLMFPQGLAGLARRRSASDVRSGDG
jgi:hypothetical protein